MVKTLGSSKLAAVLIGVLLALCLVSFVVPQRSHSALTLYDQWSEGNPAVASAAESLGLDDVFASPLFFVVTALLGLNLTVCTVDRALRRGRRSYGHPPEPPQSAETVLLAGDLDTVESALSQSMPFWRKSRLRRDTGLSLVFQRETYGFAGSMVLHGGILLLLVGGLVSGLTRFDGSMVFTEGETLADERASYSGAPKEPVFGEAYGPFAIRLDALRFDYEGHFITQSYADMSFREQGVSGTDTSKVNVPARWRGKSFLMVKGGHAVRLMVSDENGEEIYPHSVVRLGDSTETGYRDRIELQDGRIIELTTQADGSSRSRSAEQKMRLTDPVVQVAVDEAAEQAVLRPGESATLEGLVVTIGDVRLWNEFAVRQDRGIPITYGAFALILLGTAARLFFGKRVVRCFAVEGDSGALVSVWARDKTDAEKVVRLLERIGQGS